MYFSYIKICKPTVMAIRLLEDKMLLSDKNDVLRVYLYSKLLQHGIRPYEKDMDFLLELYQFGCYNSTERQNEFIKLCLTKKLKRSGQSVRNTLSKYKNLNVLRKPKNRMIEFNEEFIPTVECDKIVLQSLISHRN